MSTVPHHKYTLEELTAAYPEVKHVQLDAVLPEVIPRTEGVVERVIVIFQPEALRFILNNGRPHHIKVAKLPKEGKTRVVIAEPTRAA
jgi:hypothetical protein